MQKNINNPKEQDQSLYRWIGSFSSNKKTTVIELIGLPGSGKSTLANTICLWHIKNVIVFSDTKCLKGKEGGLNNKIVSSLLRVYRRILFSTHRLKLLIQNNKAFIYYKILINNSPIPRKVKKARLRMWLSGSRFYSKKNNTSLKKILIHDEGLIYRAMSLSQSDVNLIDVDKYLDLLPKPDALIYIYSSENVIKKRLNKREYKTVNHVKLMHKSEMAFKRIKSKYDNVESFDYYSDIG